MSWLLPFPRISSHVCSELCAGDAGRARLRELGQRKEKIAQISPFLCLFFHVFDVQIAKGRKKILVEPQMSGLGIFRELCLNYILGKGTGARAESSLV